MGEFGSEGKAAVGDDLGRDELVQGLEGALGRGVQLREGASLLDIQVAPAIRLINAEV